MLSNIQAGGHPLLQIVLLGQPEFRDSLHGSDRLEQLRQRVIAIHHLDPMAPQEIEPYMIHRLSLVGWEGKPGFTRDAFEALHEARSEEHTSELQSLMRISYAVFFLKTKSNTNLITHATQSHEQYVVCR